MIKAWNAFFSMLANLFVAGDNGSLALVHVTGYLRETAEAFEDKARIERLASLTALTAE